TISRRILDSIGITDPGPMALALTRSWLAGAEELALLGEESGLPQDAVIESALASLRGISTMPDLRDLVAESDRPPHQTGEPTGRHTAEKPRISSRDPGLLPRRWRWDLNPRLGVAQQSISSASPSAARTRHRRSGYKKRGLIRKSAGRRADRPIYWAASVAGELVGGLV